MDGKDLQLTIHRRDPERLSRHRRMIIVADLASSPGLPGQLG
jgi:hypothetical protein